MQAERVLNATCPECRGPLREVVEDGHVEYRCLVEHRYSALTVLPAHVEAEERALWEAVLALQESAILAREVAAHLPEAVAEHIRREAVQKEEQAAIVRGVVEALKQYVIE